MGVLKAATISECGLYRYSLGRAWTQEGGLLMFVMLNPSTADAYEDDPTIRRCIGFARDAGFGGIWVGNLFAFRATKPAELWAAKAEGVDIEGPDNVEALNLMASKSRAIVCAWGAHGAKAPGEVDAVGKSFEPSRELLCLGTTKDLHPRHPLYLSKMARFETWRDGEVRS